MAHSLLFRRLIHTLQMARRRNLEAEGKPAPLSTTQVLWTRRRFIKFAGLTGSAAQYLNQHHYLGKVTG
jgi:hypothetical protein